MLALTDEAGRLAVLRQLNLLDTPPSEEFDRLTLLAARMFGVPIALITLIDATRQWVKSAHGAPSHDMPRGATFCEHVVRDRQTLVVADASEDPRFPATPFAASGAPVRFYAGAPLITRDGHVIGTLCVFDYVARSFTAAERHSLEILAAQVMTVIELRHSSGRLHPSSRLPNGAQFGEDLADLTRRLPGQSRILVVIDVVDPDHLPTHINLLGPRWERELPAVVIRGIRAVFGDDLTIYHPLSLRFAFLLDPSASPGWQDKLDQMMARFRQKTIDEVPIALAPSLGVVPFRLGDFADQVLLQRGVMAAHEARAVGRMLSPAHDGPGSAPGSTPGSAPGSANDWHDAHMLLGELRRALALPGQLSLAFQPRLDFTSGACHAVEALIRWNHPTLGPVSPGEFIPLVEQTTLMTELTLWVMDTAMREIAAFRACGVALRVSINVSASDLQSSDIAGRIAALLARHDLPAEAIELEFTESSLLPNRSFVHQQLRAIRERGIDIAIDDFGTGYSNLAYLKSMPASVVKLDQSFIRMLATSARDRAIVKAAILMAHELGYRVVAEGIETEEICAMVAGWGCDEGQGYHIARPMTAVQLAAWLTERAAPAVAVSLP